jgi:hypothetical protein
VKTGATASKPAGAEIDMVEFEDEKEELRADELEVDELEAGELVSEERLAEIPWQAPKSNGRKTRRYFSTKLSGKVLIVMRRFTKRNKRWPLRQRTWLFPSNSATFCDRPRSIAPSKRGGAPRR